MSLLLCLFEDDQVHHLRPLTETRAAFDVRVGLRTLLETAEDAFAPLSITGLALQTRPYLAPVTAHAHPSARVNDLPDDTDVLFVNARALLHDQGVVDEIRATVGQEAPSRAFTTNDQIVAAWIPRAQRPLSSRADVMPPWSPSVFGDLPTVDLPSATLVERPWDLLDGLRAAIERDVNVRTEAPPSRPLSARPQADVHESVVGVRHDHIYLGQDVEVRPGAILNAEEGTIYVGPNATIHERAVVRGPCYIGPKTHIKIGANVEGASFGYWCKVGGEVHDTVMHSLSNKAHPGFLGHSYLGRWCNLGADTNTSNLKNDYGEVSAYAPAEQTFVGTGRQFAGLFMGDHTKCGINTMFNTGTVVGTFSNVFGGDFPPQYLPPFSWGGPRAGFAEYRLDKALAVAERVMARRDASFTEAHQTLLATLFEETKAERKNHLS